MNCRCNASGRVSKVSGSERQLGEEMFFRLQKETIKDIHAVVLWEVFPQNKARLQKIKAFAIAT